MTDAPLLFLHGWGGSFTSTFGNHWHEAAWAIGRRPVGIDLPGHADPAASIDPLDYADLAGLVARRLPDEPMDVIAFSLGGKIALALALALPARFRRLVIGGVGDNIFAPEANGQVLADALTNGVSTADSAHVKAMVNYARSSGSEPRALAALLRRPHNPVHRLDAIGALTPPTLIVNGSEDSVALPDEHLARASAALSIIHVPGVDHPSLPDNSDFCRRAISFIAEPKE